MQTKTWVVSLQHRLYNFISEAGVNDDWCRSTCVQTEGNSQRERRQAGSVHLCLCVTDLVKDTDHDICSLINTFAL